MYYFDNEFLKQYLEQGLKLKVFVDGNYYSIADESDLEDELYGIGYDLNGKPHRFDYRNIELIDTGRFKIQVDDLEKLFGDTDSEEQPEETPEEQPEEKPEEPEKEESYHNVVDKMILDVKKNKTKKYADIAVGDIVENIDIYSPNYATRGMVTNIEVYDDDVVIEYLAFNSGVDVNSSKLGSRIYASYDELKRG
jgi:hypothetical protein